MNELKKFLTRYPKAAPFTAEAIFLFLSGLPRGTSVDIYGCGLFSKHVVEILATNPLLISIRFIETDPQGKIDFKGYKLIAPQYAVDNPADIVLLSSAEYDASMRANLEGHVNVVLGLEEIFDKMDSNELEEKVIEFAKAEAKCFANKVLKNLDAKPIVFYFTAVPGLQYFKLMKAIKKLGYSLILCTGRKDLTESINIDHYAGKGFFDEYYVYTPYVVDELSTLIDNMHPKLLHLDVTAGDVSFYAVGMEKWNVPIVLDYRDIWETLYSTDTEKLYNMSADEYAIGNEHRRKIFKAGAGVITKDDYAALNFIEKRHKHRPEHVLQYFPYLDEECVASDLESSGGKGLVVTASICMDPSNPIYMNFVSILEAGKIISAQKIHFTVYDGAASPNNKCEQFVQEDLINPFFHYKTALPNELLINELSEYDYAFFSFDYDCDLEEKLYLRTSFGSRLITYLAAGLPILMTPDLAWMAKIVEEMDFGLICHYSELPRLKTILANVDRQKLKKKLPKLQRQWSHAYHAPRLQEFYTSIINENLEKP